MKICFFNRSYWPDQAATGQLLTELAEDLVSRYGCEVTVVAGRALHASRDGKPAGDCAPVDARSAPRRRHSPRQRHAAAAAALRRRGPRTTSRYFASATRRQLRHRPARRRRVADRSADSRPGGAVGGAAHRRALRVPVRGHFSGSGGAARGLSERGRQPRRSIASTAICCATPTPSSRSATACGGGWSRKRAPIPARVHVIHNWADCEAIVPGPKDNAFAREHGLADRFVADALGQRRAVAEPRRADRGGRPAAVEGAADDRHRRRRREAAAARARWRRRAA